jgi:TRAP-type C4-dicarboxylate transport system substrate-binding protein
MLKHEANSGNAVTFRLLGGGMLGDEPTLVAALESGGISAVAVTSTAAEAVVPELSVFTLPFLFRDGAEADRVIETLWPELTRLFDRRGYWLMAHTVVGFRHLGSQHKLNTMDDLRRVVPRSQPGAIHARMWELAGVRHQAIGQLAVMQGLETGLITGFDGSLPWIFAASWHLKIKHLTLTHHLYQPGFMFMGKKGQAQLPKGLKRERLTAGILAVCSRAIRAIRKVDTELLAALPAVGVSVDEPAAAFLAAFRSAVMPLHAEWEKKTSPEGRKLLAAIRRELAKRREQH